METMNPAIQELVDELNALRTEVARLRVLEDTRNGAEQALAQSEIFSQALLKSLPAQIAVIDKRGKILGINNSWERVASNSKKNTLICGEIGNNYLGSLEKVTGEVAQYAEVCIKGLQRVLEGQESGIDLTYPSSTEGETEYWLMRCVAISHESGGAVLAHFDITQQRRTERALADNLASFRLLFDSHPHPMWVYDAQTFDFLEINTVATLQYGYSRSQFLAMNLHDIVDGPEDQFINPKPQEGAAVAGKESKHRLSNGMVLDVSVVSYALEFNGRPAVLSIAEQIAERKRLELRLIQSHRMDITGRLASGIAHSLDDYLREIIIFSHSALTLTAESKVVANDLVQIANSANRASNMLQQLLAFARRQTIEPRSIPVQRVIEIMEPVCKTILGDLITINAEIGSHVGSVYADPEQLQLVVASLADFALSRMPEGGDFVIKIDVQLIDEDTAIRGVRVAAGRYVTFEFNDTGSPISDIDRENIFEPFFMTHDSQRSSGLGLATVYGACKQAGGYVWVYNDRPIGTRFVIYLPQAEFTANASLGHEPDAQRQAGTVMVVDEQPLIRSMAIQCLRTIGYTVIEASDGSEAMRIARDYTGNIDLLIADISMSRVSGVEVWESLRNRYPEIKGIFTSENYPLSLPVSLRGCPDVDIIQKPFLVETLAEHVKTAIGVQD